MAKVAFIAVKCGGEELRIRSDFNAQITLPNAALGRLIDFEYLKMYPISHILAKYWVGHYMIFNKKILRMFKSFGAFPSPQLRFELEKLPYVQLFIMSIIKSDAVMFDRLYPFIDTSDLEMCYYVSQHQFSGKYESTPEEERQETIVQSILALFRHIRINKTQTAMLNAILKKMTIQHIVYQIYMLECDKFNVPMYNLVAVHVEQLVMLFGYPVDKTLWSTWPYIHMPNIEREIPSAVYATGPNWPHAGLDGQQYKVNSPKVHRPVSTQSKADQTEKKIQISKYQNPIWKISYDPLTHHQMHEMCTCPNLNPSLRSVQQLDDTHELPRAKKDYSELLGLAPARAIEFSWPRV
jgi:hypothetical protein